jgi:hypothetical protein
MSNYRHGLCYTPEYAIHQAAKDRCTRTKSKFYANYGGRGIRFMFKTFLEFWKELGPRPTEQHTLDRINNDGNYEKGNVRWATRSTQIENRRITQSEVALIRWKKEKDHASV